MSVREVVGFFSGQNRTILILIAAWVLAMIGLPIVRWTLGDAALPAGISVGVLLQIVAVAAICSRAWGVRATLITFAVVVALAWSFEFVGHTTDVPFGAYDYTEKLQPQLGGVPLLVPLAWLMMLPPSWALAWRIAQRVAPARRGLAFIGFSALTMTAWDLFLDPQMVGWDLWRWEDPSGFTYFGIPWINYAGWLLATGTITLAAYSVPRSPLKAQGSAPNFPPLLIVVYAITWALETIGQIVFWGLPYTGVIGGLVMGGLLWWGVKKT